MSSQPHRGGHRARRRGVVFVEAIIVVTFFTICFLGVVYFHNMYVARLRTQRLARASALAFATTACAGDPRAGLEGDLPVNGAPPELPPPGGPSPLPPISDKRAADALDKVDRSSGGAPLARTTKITVQMHAAATTQKDPSAPKQGFERDVASTSTVMCMDPVSRDGVTEMIPRVRDILGDIFQ
ncbi:MAG: hypothetical protein JWP97_4000 [Labilithrix sp.]|nr:hypothetical protein [Labilithrix sp.]